MVQASEQAKPVGQHGFAPRSTATLIRVMQGRGYVDQVHLAVCTDGTSERIARLLLAGRLVGPL